MPITGLLSKYSMTNLSLSKLNLSTFRLLYMFFNQMEQYFVISKVKQAFLCFIVEDP